MNDRLSMPALAAAHLRPEVWAGVNRALCAKAIGEFAHELLISPVITQPGAELSQYVLATDHPGVEYRFAARLMQLDHWYIDRASLHKLVHGRDTALDAMGLVVELRETLGIPAHVLAEYLEEIASTLSAAAYKHVHQRQTAAELVHADFQQLETAMTEGHPCFVANNARIGFNALDYHAHAPEAARPQPLIWLAALAQRTDFACTQGLSYPQLVQQELGAQTIQLFDGALRARGLDPALYRFIPVHPWQWDNRIAQLFASDLARDELVLLGRGPDQYLAQQSIRTFYNVTTPHRRYVKTALSIRNMGFTRGLSAKLGPSAAAVNDWLLQLLQGDPYLGRLGFSALPEVAFIGFRQRHYERASEKRVDPYKEMLAALYRQNPNAGLSPGQRLMTMAGLMHVDRDGASLLSALITASGVTADVWVKRYLDCYLKPLLHCFFAHRLVFTPHCENVILVLQDALPVRVIIKDVGEDIGVLNARTALPERVRHIALRVPEEVMTLSIFTDCFDCVFRFLAQILWQHVRLPELRFWRLVAECIRDYEREQPQLAAEFARYDLFAPTFIRNCLNRLQLRNNTMMVDLNAPEPVDSLQFAGTLDNPIAPFRAAMERAPTGVS